MILLCGGTRLSARVAERLRAEGRELQVTVSRETARRLYPELPAESIHAGRRDAGGLLRLASRWHLETVVDATHPFATEISANAIRVANRLQIPYVFVDRPRSLPDNHPRLTWAEDWGQAVERCKTGRRILLTIGVKHLPQFAALGSSPQLYVRVLPRTDSLRRAREAGYPPSRIIALWPPVSRRLEESLIDEYELDMVVTKASGPDGGVPQKWEAVKRRKIRLLAVRRPRRQYPRRVNDPDELVSWMNNREHAT